MAKKTKPTKPSSKKVTKKAVTRSASSKKKKAAPKKTIVKKAATKKVVAKKKAVTKPVSRKGKKSAAKPASPAGRKGLIKKATPKKAVTKKITVKKGAAKKMPAKVITKAAPPEVKKKAVLVKMPQPAVPLPPVEEGLETLVGKAANIDTGSNQMMVPGDGLNEAPLITEDPVKTFDKNVFNKATANGVPHSNLQFSSKPKNAVKPSGKKPLWNK